MFNKLGFASLMGLVGVVTVATSSQAEQSCSQDVPYVIGASVSCSTANGNVSATADALVVGGTPRVRANLTKGVDTGQAATRDSGSATGYTPGRLIDCVAIDRNPSVGSSETSNANQICEQSTILNVFGRDKP